MKSRSDDERNREDIDPYLSLKMFSLSQSMVQKLEISLAILDNENPTPNMVSTLAEKGQGHFLFVKIALDLWLTSTENIRWETFPKTLERLYQFYFERKYRSSESFQSLCQILEVLVLACTPSCISSTPPFIPSVQKYKKCISSEFYVYGNLHIYLPKTALHAGQSEKDIFRLLDYC